MPALELRKPIMNAAGCMGFAPKLMGHPLLETFGAFVTNPISVQRRRASNRIQHFDYSEGILLHTGWPNPGLKSSLKRYGPAWARAQLPIIVHLLADELQAFSKAVQRIEEQENIMAIEIGLDGRASNQLVTDICRAASGELPFIAQLPFERALELAPVVINGGASAVSLSAPRGSLPDPTGEVVSRWLFGPSIFPQALDVVALLNDFDIMVIGAGGIYDPEEAGAMLKAGASAIQLDTVLWKGEFDITEWGKI